MKYRASPNWPYHVSCGGVVYRKKHKRIEVALLESHHKDRFPWHLPKGTLEDGETIEVAAQREVAEESGLESEIETYLGATHYTLPKEVEGFVIEKTVHYFLLRYSGEHANGMDGEYKRLHWVNIDQAIERMKDSYKSEFLIIERAKTWIQNH